MQLLLGASSKASSVEACARELLDVVPLVMRIIRKHMRQHRSGLSVPQFRSLCFISTTEGSSLSAVADFIGLSLPAMSRLVDGLVDKGLVARKPCADDRRHVRLSVTTEGESALRGARELAQTQLAGAIAKLSREQRSAVAGTMQMLRDVFTPELAGGDGSAEHADAGAAG